MTDPHAIVWASKGFGEAWFGREEPDWRLEMCLAASTILSHMNQVEV